MELKLISRKQLGKGSSLFLFGKKRWRIPYHLTFFLFLVSYIAKGLSQRCKWSCLFQFVSCFERTLPLFNGDPNQFFSANGKNPGPLAKILVLKSYYDYLFNLISGWSTGPQFRLQSAIQRSCNAIWCKSRIFTNDVTCRKLKRDDLGLQTINIWILALKDQIYILRFVYS